MWRERSPGLKILWLWTFGTAAVLVTSVIRTRVKDMEKILYAQEEEEQQQPMPDIPTDSKLMGFDGDDDSS